MAASSSADGPRSPNRRLAAVIAESGLSHAQVARLVVRLAAECGARELLAVGRSHVSHWVGGSRPSGRAPEVLREALSRSVGRVVTIGELGFSPAEPSSPLDWTADTLVELADLGRVDVDVERRQLLAAATYSAAALTLPVGSWWSDMAAVSRRPRRVGPRVGRADLDAVREMAALFSQVDQRRGGGHGRTALVQYLATDVAGLLGGTFVDDATRRDMFATAGELSYLSGWMAFDNSEHAVAQRYFALAVKLAAEADNAPLAGHVLRAMAHQAIDLRHPSQALQLAQAAIEGNRYEQASPRERALLGVVHARALTVNGHRARASAALIRAEDDLSAAVSDATGPEEPSRVYFFGEASLAHETACALRTTGDLAGAEREFRRSVRTRKAATFTRTHAVTLGYLGAVQARQGALEEACATWAQALDTMEGVRSGRTRKVAVEIRSVLSTVKGRGIRLVAELDNRAARYLSEG